MIEKESEHDEMLRVTAEMNLYGGSFAQALSKTMQVADKINLEKLKDAFPVYWRVYKLQADKRQEE